MDCDASLILLAENKTGLLFSKLKPLEVDPVALDEDVAKKLFAVRQGKILFKSDIKISFDFSFNLVSYNWLTNILFVNVV